MPAPVIFRTLRFLRLQLAWRRHSWQRTPISFAQASEDLVLAALLGRVETFIDIGANDGETFSNTLRFALEGARGLAFEAVPATARRLAAFYRFNARVRCVPEAISDRSGTIMIAEAGLYSAIGGTAGTRVPCRPLRVWLERHPEFQRADVVSLDVEGHELAVLHGIGFPFFQPRCLVIEMHSGAHRDAAEIDDLLAHHGYQPVLANALNTFYASPALAASAAGIAARFPGFTACPARAS